MTTIQRVPRPRGELDPEQARRLERANEKRHQADAAYRAVVVALLDEGVSFAELSTATGHSTRTLQNWKREAR